MGGELPMRPKSVGENLAFTIVPPGLAFAMMGYASKWGEL
jgi:hypothetical protein